MFTNIENAVNIFFFKLTLLVLKPDRLNLLYNMSKKLIFFFYNIQQTNGYIMLKFS